MNASISPAHRSWSVTHSLVAEDRVAVRKLRALVEPLKGKMQGAAARGLIDAFMSWVMAPEGIRFEADTINGIPGWWCRPVEAPPDAGILHLHGGWFHWGSALAYRNLIGHLALRARANAFVPDYRLAPEHPFPAGVDDAKACFGGLVERGIDRIALSGDSAGGALALVLASVLTPRASKNLKRPLGVVALSPVTDLTLAGESWTTRSAIDPYFTRAQARDLVRSYLGGASPTDPRASALFADLADLPPVRVLVGDDEVLLDDAIRYVARAVSAGVDAQLDIWQGMPHGFTSGVGKLTAANEAMAAAGTFLRECLAVRKSDRDEDHHFKRTFINECQETVQS